MPAPFEEYEYDNIDGKFSCNFEAPLLGNVGDYVTIFDFYTNDGSTFSEQPIPLGGFEILEIDRENKKVICTTGLDKSA